MKFSASSGLRLKRDISLDRVQAQVAYAAILVTSPSQVLCLSAVNENAFKCAEMPYGLAHGRVFTGENSCAPGKS